MVLRHSPEAFRQGRDGWLAVAWIVPWIRPTERSTRRGTDSLVYYSRLKEQEDMDLGTKYLVGVRETRKILFGFILIQTLMVRREQIGF